MGPDSVAGATSACWGRLIDHWTGPTTRCCTVFAVRIVSTHTADVAEPWALEAVPVGLVQADNRAT